MTTATTGPDTIYGTDGNDTIDGLGGNDWIYVSLGTDTINGNTGFDRLIIDFSIGGLAAYGRNGKIFTLTNTRFYSSDGLIDTTYSSIEGTKEITAVGFTNSTFNLSAHTSNITLYLPSTAGMVSGNNTVVASSFSGWAFFSGFGNSYQGGTGAFDSAGYQPLLGGADHVVTVSFNGSSGQISQDGMVAVTATNAERMYVGVIHGPVYADTGLVVDASAATGSVGFFDSAGDDIFVGGNAVDYFSTVSIDGSGLGTDYYIGGGGLERWDFVGSANGIDGTRILDFEVGEVIDLSSNNGSGHSFVATTFIGENPFNGVAGEVRYVRANGETVVQFDTNGDTLVDGTLTILNGEFPLESFDPSGLGGFAIRASGPSVNNRLIRGTTGADNLNGTSDDDLMIGLTGADIMLAGAGNDEALGGAGNDFLVGGPGNDIVRGGDGDDGLQGGFHFNGVTFSFTPESDFAGDDQFFGGNGVDGVFYGTGTVALTVDLRITGPQNTGYGMDSFDSVEIIIGTAKGDTLIGDDQPNWLQGGADQTSSGSNNDNLQGMGGDDILSTARGDHVVDGGDGSDWYHLDEVNQGGPGTPQVMTNISLLLQGQTQDIGFGTLYLTDIENLSGSYGTDTLTGDDNANILAGSSGNDRLIGNGGNDVLFGDSRVSLGEGGPIITIFSTGSAFNDVLFGDEGNDIIFGELGDDVLNGGAGSDIMRGGIGNDTYYVDDIGDQVIELVSEGYDTVRTSYAIYVLPAEVERLLGNSNTGQTLIGNSLANIITGALGNDTLRGGLGNDDLADNGSTLRDVAVFSGNSSAYSIVSGSAADFTITGPDGTDRLRNIEILRFDNGNFKFSSNGIVPISAETRTDFDGDGGDDVLFQNTGTGAMDAINGEGGVQRTFGTKPVGGLVEMADFNGDGTQDLLFNLGGGRLVSYRGETYGVLNDYGTRPGHTLLNVADFDGDGGADLLFQRASDGFTFVINGEGGFQRDFGTKPVGGLIAVGDFNGDGTADLLFDMGGGRLISFKGQTYGVVNDYGTRPGHTLLTVGDFDGDGGDDLLFQRTSDGYTFVINGEGGFQRDFGSKPVGGLVAVGDLNGDGTDDLLFDMGGGNLVSYRGETYGALNTYGARPGQTLLALADFDGDGGVDLLFQRTSDGFMTVINGEGGFQRDFGTKPVGGLETIGDFDGDGSADLLIRFADNSVRSYTGDTYGILADYGVRTGQAVQHFDDLLGLSML